MRKLITLLLTATSSLSITGEVLQTFSYQHTLTNSQNFKNKNTTRKINDYHIKNYNDWDTISKMVNDNIEAYSQPSKTDKSVAALSKENIAIVKAKSQEIIEDLKANHQNIKDAPEYLTNNEKYHNLKDAIQHPERHFTEQSDKIFQQYFGSNRIDLKLDGMQTYQEAVDTLIKEINQNYPNNNWKISLSDKSLKTKTLFDDTDATKIIAFVNNQTNINVNITKNGKPTEKATVKLTNIKLDPRKDSQQLFEAILSYFDPSNSQDLNLKITDDFGKVIGNILQKIDARFNYKFTPLNPEGSLPKDGIWIYWDGLNHGEKFTTTFNQDETSLINILNDNLTINFKCANFSSPESGPASLKGVLTRSMTIKNIQFDLSTMKDTLKRLFDHQVTEKHAQSLGLSTDNTLQEALDKFNERLTTFNKNNDFYFDATFQQPTVANTKLETQYNPTQANNNFHLDVNLSINLKGQKTDLGQYRICLKDVILGNTSLKLKTAFNGVQTKMITIKYSFAILVGMSAIAAIVTAALWISVLFTFGATAAQALNATVATGCLIAVSATLGYFTNSFDAHLIMWSKIVLSITTILIFFATFLPMTVAAVLSGMCILETSGWAVGPLIFLALLTLTAVTFTQLEILKDLKK